MAVTGSTEPRKAKILSPTLTTTSPSQGSSRHAPGLARQYASQSILTIPASPPRWRSVRRRRRRTSPDGTGGPEATVLDGRDEPVPLVLGPGDPTLRRLGQHAHGIGVHEVEPLLLHPDEQP